MQQWTNQTNRPGDTDRHWQLGAEDAIQVLARRNQTGTTQPLSQLSAADADRVLQAASAASPRRRVPAMPPEDLPKVMIDPSLTLAEPPMTAAITTPVKPAGWMFAPETGGRPSVIDDDELARATARPVGGFLRWVGRLFRG